MLIYLSMVLALFAVLVGVVWWLDPVPPDDVFQQAFSTGDPDDPWMLKYGHRLAHHYGEGMGPGSADHALQEAALRKQDARDARLAAIHLEHTEPSPRIHLVSAMAKKS